MGLRRDNPRGMLGDTGEKLVNHDPKASVLQAFRVFSQHLTPVNPFVVYCFYKITWSFLRVFRHNKTSVFNQSERAYHLSYFIKFDSSKYMKSACWHWKHTTLLYKITGQRYISREECLRFCNGSLERANYIYEVRSKRPSKLQINHQVQ